MKIVDVYQLMCVFCDRLKFGSTAALDCRTGQNKGRYHEKDPVVTVPYFVIESHTSSTNHQ